MTRALSGADTLERRGSRSRGAAYPSSIRRQTPPILRSWRFTAPQAMRCTLASSTPSALAWRAQAALKAAR